MDFAFLDVRSTSVGELKMVNRGQHWTDAEIYALLEIWGDNTQSQLEGAYRNDSVFQKIAAALASRGFNRSANQCRNKLKALKKSTKTSVISRGEVEQVLSLKKKE